jgi:tetratricopeptide (TPR) repeat protein
MAAADGYLKADPEGLGAPEALYFKGRALEQRVKRDEAQFVRDLTDAKALYVRAIQLGPTRELKAYILTSLGNVTYWLHDYAPAIAAFKEAHALLPGGDLKGWTLYRLGLSQQRQGQWADADSTFAAVQSQFPGTELSQRAREHRGARGFYVQVAAFKDVRNAENLVASLRRQGYASQRIPKPERRLHAVVAGPARTYAEAMQLKLRLSPQFKDAIITP